MQILNNLCQYYYQSIFFQTEGTMELVKSIYFLSFQLCSPV